MNIGLSKCLIEIISPNKVLCPRRDHGIIHACAPIYSLGLLSHRILAPRDHGRIYSFAPFHSLGLLLYSIPFPSSFPFRAISGPFPPVQIEEHDCIYWCPHLILPKAHNGSSRVLRIYFWCTCRHHWMFVWILSLLLFCWIRWFQFCRAPLQQVSLVQWPRSPQIQMFYSFSGYVPQSDSLYTPWISRDHYRCAPRLSHEYWRVHLQSHAKEHSKLWRSNCHLCWLWSSTV